MSAVFEEVTLGWRGETYNITPDMRLLNRIEQTVSLSRLANRLVNADPPISQLATVVAEMLRKGGAQVTDEEVYQELMTGDPDAVHQMAAVVMRAVFPQPLGKGEAQAPTTKAAKKATSKK